MSSQIKHTHSHQDTKKQNGLPFHYIRDGKNVMKFNPPLPPLCIRIIHPSDQLTTLTRMILVTNYP